MLGDYVPVSYSRPAAPLRVSPLAHRALPFSMRPFAFSPRTLFAPLHGVGRPEFRELLACLGPIGLMCAPFVRVTKAPLGHAWLRAQVRRAGNTALSVQLLGREPQPLADAARVLVDAGVDAIDVNLGCPARRMVRKGVGAALLREPDTFDAVLRTLRSAVPVVLSAKIRAGFDDFDSAIALAKRAEATGVDFLTVHPRRRSDHYDGVADWSIVAKIARELKIPVVGNGDLWYAADALRLERQCGCSAVMIGRPALRNPWIFRQIADLEAGRAPYAPSGDDLVDYLSQVLAMLGRARNGPPSEAIAPFKELVGWVVSAVPEPKDIRQRALRSNSVDEILGLVRNYLAGRPAVDFDLGAEPVYGLAPRPSVSAQLAPGTLP